MTEEQLESNHEEIGYYSNEMQDVAALRLLKNADSPTFLDIGGRHPVELNNSLLLEENGWSGICVDIDDYSEEFKEKRQTPFYQIDSCVLTLSSLLRILTSRIPISLFPFPLPNLAIYPHGVS